ncbi:MAG: tetratricopeptide repeat protein [Acidobacteriaceae bacterium]
MSRWARSRAVILGLVVASATTLSAASQEQQTLNRKFQAAVADYNAGHYAEAAVKLERLLPEVRNSFEVHELLGLSYASLSRDDDAIRELQAAVRLKPASAAARTNLAASLSHAGDSELAAEQFHKALALEPNNYTANHNLGEYYIGAGKLPEAVPLLARAQKINPTAYDNGYDLATAELLTDHLPEARQIADKLLASRNTGELHNLLGQIDEKQGNYLAAAHDYETAAHIDPSDDNLFAWGGELLIHRTYEPAVSVFQFATKRYPNSPRLQIGLGMALYARGLYPESVAALLKAVDLAPDDPRCYQFLARAYDRSPQQVDEVIERFRRYATLQPANAQAQYYYAMSLWKGKRLEQSSPDLQTVQDLLKKSVALDPKFADAHQQLGNLYASQRNYQDSISEYQRSIELNPNQPDAHYRLATDYVHVGEKDRADRQFAIYQKQRAQHMAENDAERAEVKQFVYSTKDNATRKP